MAQNEINPNERNETAQDEMLAAILQRIGGASPSGTSPPSQSISEAQSVSAGGSGDILSSLLSNPELIAKLPTIIASIKPIIDMLGRANPTASEAAPVVSLPQKSEPSVAPVAKVSRGPDSRTALLCAMKPYLSEDRRNAVDYIVKLGRLGDILKTL